MKIDFEKIVNNALQTLVAAMIVGACAIVWNEATTVQDKIRASEKRQEVTVDAIETAMGNISSDMEVVLARLDSIEREQKLTNSLSIDKILAPFKNGFNIATPTPTPEPVPSVSEMQPSMMMEEMNDSAVIEPEPIEETPEPLKTPIQEQIQMKRYSIKEELQGKL